MCLEHTISDFLAHAEKNYFDAAPAVVAHDVPLSHLCTMRVGGRTAGVLSPPDMADFCQLLKEATDARIPYLILGAGSNVVPGDRDFCGIVFSTRQLQKVQIFETKIRAECGCLLNCLILHAAKHNLGGIERLYGIPGTVGGAVKMNAGAHGMDIATSLECATLFSPRNGEVRIVSNQELAFSYRDSLLQHNRDLVVLDATFRGVPTSREDVKQTIADVVRLRLHSQPIEFPSAGSVFRRPTEGEVWRMVDRCGLRGYCIGGAQVSSKHAGFIVNRDSASAEDICRLVGHIHACVRDACGVHLVPEIEFFHLSEEEKCHLPIL